jgi:hypothetical protein
MKNENQKQPAKRIAFIIDQWTAELLENFGDCDKVELHKRFFRRGLFETLHENNINTKKPKFWKPKK